MNQHHSRRHARSLVLCGLLAAGVGLCGCASIPAPILDAPDTIRTQLQAIAASEDLSVRKLSSSAAQSAADNRALLGEIGDWRKAYRLQVIHAGQSQVLAEFDDRAFSLLTLGLATQLKSNAAYQQLSALEAKERVDLDAAIVKEETYKDDFNVHNSRLLAQQQWQATYKLLSDLQNELRGALLAQLVLKRELFRETVVDTFAKLAADESSVPVLPDPPATDIALETDKYLGNLSTANAAIDQAMVELSASMRYETSYLKIGEQWIKGASVGVIGDLGQNSLIASLSANALSKNAPDLVKDVQTAVQLLTAQASSAVSDAAAAASGSTTTSATATTSTTPAAASTNT